MKNLIIVSFVFPPSGRIASMRFGELVPFLEDGGYRPWIITTHSDGDLPVLIPEEQILRVGENTFFENHPRSSEELGKWGWIMRGLALRLNFKPRVFDRYFFSWPRRVEESLSSFLEKIGKVDLVIGTYSPASSFKVARNISQRVKAPWIADFRDLGALFDDDRGWMVKAADRVIERRLISSASALTSVGQYLADLLKEKYHKESEAIFNGWYKGKDHEMNLSPPPLSDEFSTPYLYYAGTINTHQIESFSLLLNALKDEKGLSLVCRPIGTETDLKKFYSTLEMSNVSDRVRILPFAPKVQVEREANRSRANLIFEDLSVTNRSSRGTITGKFLQLLISKPPILTIARADSEIGSILKATMRGEVVSNLATLKNFLERLRGNRVNYFGNQQMIEEYSKRNQAKKLCHFLDRVLRQSTPKPTL